MQLQKVKSVLCKFPLFPILKDGDGRARCGCNSLACTAIGKHPMVQWGELAKGEAIAGAGEYGTGYGIATGRRSGFFVVDIDVKNGVDGWKSLEGFDLPDTYHVGTPSGGMHLYYALPDFDVPSLVGLFPGVDIRGEKGYVVGPGSPHRNGGVYTAKGPNEIAAPPPGLVQVLRDRAHAMATRAESGAETVTPIDPLHPEWSYRIREAEKYLASAPPCIDGKGGHRQLFIVASVLVRRLELPDEACRRLLVPYNKRCEGPWSDEEIEHKLRQARERGQMDTGTASEKALENLVAAAQRGARGVTVEEGPEPAPGAEHVHAYTFKPGIDRGLGKKARISTEDAASAMVGPGAHPDWLGVWRYDVFRDRIRAVNPPCPLDAETRGLTENDITKICLWYEKEGQLLSENAAWKIVKLAAHANAFHPVRDYLDGLPPMSREDAEGVFAGIAGRLWGAEGEKDELESECLKKLLIGAVRRIRRPGTQVDTVLVLYGAQGFFKSSFCRKLFGEFFRDQMPELAGRDASHALEGFWGIEIAELARMQKQSPETIKEFLSRPVDTYRQFGNGEKIEKPRQCVFIGTTNQETFLTDSTGNRRYWICTVQRPIDLSFDRNALWAAACALEAAGMPHWMDEAWEARLEARRPEHEEFDPWDDDVDSAIAAMRAEGVTDVRADFILARIVKDDVSKRDERALKRVQKILRRKLGPSRAIKYRVDDGTRKSVRVYPLPTVAEGEKE